VIRGRGARDRLAAASTPRYERQHGKMKLKLHDCFQHIFIEASKSLTSRSRLQLNLASISYLRWHIRLQRQHIRTQLILSLDSPIEQKVPTSPELKFNSKVCCWHKTAIMPGHKRQRSLVPKEIEGSTMKCGSLAGHRIESQEQIAIVEIALA